MIEILSESEPDTLAVAISGTLTSDDYQTLEPELQLRADRDHPFQLLVELTDVDGLEPGTIRDNLVFTKDFADDISHMAVVIDNAPWAGIATAIGSPIASLLGVDVEQFDDRVEAWKWLRPDSSPSD